MVIRKRRKPWAWKELILMTGGSSNMFSADLVGGVITIDYHSTVFFFLVVN